MCKQDNISQTFEKSQRRDIKLNEASDKTEKYDVLYRYLKRKEKKSKSDILRKSLRNEIIPGLDYSRTKKFI